MQYFKRVMLLCFLLTSIIYPQRFAGASAVCPERIVDAKFNVQGWLKKNSSDKYIISFNSYEPDFSIEINEAQVKEYFKNPYALHTIYFKLEQKILEQDGNKICAVVAVFLEAELAHRANISSSYDSACYTKTFEPITISGTLTEITGTSDFDVIVVKDGTVSSDIVCSSEQAETFFGDAALGKKVSVTYTPKQMRLDSYCLRPFFIQSGTLIAQTEAATTEAITEAITAATTVTDEAVTAVDAKKIAIYVQTLQNFPKNVSPLGKYILMAKDAYFKSFTLEDSAPNRQAGFEAFYDYYLNILAEISKDSDGFLKKLEKIANGKARGANYAEKYGFNILRQNKGPYVVKIDPVYLQNTFKGYIAGAWTDYFAFESVNQESYVLGIIDKNYKIVQEKILLGETYLKKYPESPLLQKVKEALMD